jgi:hypothetical protein
MRNRIYKILLEAMSFQDRSNINDAFWAWFGNSKVVDENGDSLVVYHGSVKDFSAFDIKKSGSKDRSVTGLFGLFFTPDASDAARYAQWNNASGSIMPVYLSIQNIYTMSHYEFEVEIGMYEFNKMKESGFRFSNEDEKRWNREVKQKVKSRKLEIQKSGHDGIFVEKLNEYIVFDPIQVKSIFNQGTWNPNDQDIMK